MSSDRYRAKLRRLEAHVRRRGLARFAEDVALARRAGDCTPKGIEFAGLVADVWRLGAETDRDDAKGSPLATTDQERTLHRRRAWLGARAAEALAGLARALEDERRALEEFRDGLRAIFAAHAACSDLLTELQAEVKIKAEEDAVQIATGGPC